MPALFTAPRFVALSTTNVLLPGAKLTFSATGTSNLQNTWQDEDLTVAHANPVVANAAGVFPPIYLDPSLPNYRVLLTDSANVTQPGYPIDDVPSNQNQAQTFRIASNTPELIFEETDATAGNKKWSVRVSAEQLTVSLLNDAETVRTDIVRLDRTGSTADLVNFLSTSLQKASVDLATLSASTFAGVVTGMDATVNITVGYKIVGNIVFIRIPSAAGTSNATSMTITGAPVAIRPARVQIVPYVAAVNNGVSELTGITVSVDTSGVLTFLRGGSATGWTGSGGKNPSSGSFDNVFCYFLN